jgi:hypothetical protein
MKITRKQLDKALEERNKMIIKLRDTPVTIKKTLSFNEIATILFKNGFMRDDKEYTRQGLEFIYKQLKKNK